MQAMSAEKTSPPVKLGIPLASGPRTWVQTERAAHEAWGRLTMKSPRAAGVMHQLVANMGHLNAVVISQKTLAKLLRCSTDTVQRAVRELERDRWIDIVRLNGPGTVAAYVVNSAVAWGEKREHMRLSVFHATVVADAEDQPEGALDRTDLRRVPIIVPPEEALLAGEGEPGAQIALPGLEPVIEANVAAEAATIPEHFEQTVAAAIARAETPGEPTTPVTDRHPDLDAAAIRALVRAQHRPK
jgi:DNA-binding transcriptional regulator YhcF (GntR family)